MRAGLLAAIGLVAGVATSALSAGIEVETRDLIASDATGRLPQERLERLAGRAQEATERILAFWSADAGVAELGKIRVIFDAPRGGIHYASVFYWEKQGAVRVRTVRVFGFEPAPQQMVHKLTSAIFPQADKLIRNLMGVATEAQLGNPRSFPGCGFGHDDWVRAFRKADVYIPLKALGPDHESWGMRIGADGYPTVFDRSRQARAYAEAGSLGKYLIANYGIDKVKRFHRQARVTERPWQGAFGAGMEQIEAGWLRALQASGGEHDALVLSSIFEKSPDHACARAQKAASGQQ